MKKKFITFAAICLAAIACTKENSLKTDKATTDAPTVTANIVDEDDTKTHLDGLNVTWSAGDQIKVISHDVWLTSSKPYGTYTLATGAGTKSATFEMTSGSAPVVTSSNKFYAIYNGSRQISFDDGGTYMYAKFSIPNAQTYVAGGVSDGLLTMLGYGTSLSDLQFQHCCGIVTLKLYTSSSTPIQISKISINSNSYISGLFYHSFYNDPTGVSVGNASPTCSQFVDLTLSEPITLSTSASSPTEFMVVLPAVSMPGFNVSVYDNTNSLVCCLLKESTLTINPGTKHVFAAVEVDPTQPYPSDATIKVGENAPVNIYAYTGTASGSVQIASSTTLTVAEINKIASILSRSADSTVSLDLSAVSVPDNIFEDWFKYTTSLYEVIFPSTITKLGNRECMLLPSSITGTIIIPEGVTYLANSALFLCRQASVQIPQSLTFFGYKNNQGLGVTVDENNPVFSSSDGVLFNKDMTTLLYYPARNTNTQYTIPSTVTVVYRNSFQGAMFLEELTVPSSVTSMRDPFSEMEALNTISLQGTSTDLSDITYNDREFFNKLYN